MTYKREGVHLPLLRPQNMAFDETRWRGGGRNRQEATSAESQKSLKVQAVDDLRNDRGETRMG